jgi:hypothetical protein
MVRRVIERRVKPVLRSDITFCILPNKAAINPAGTLEAVRQRIPWCRTLANARLQDFQQAAAFEWFLDLVSRGALPADNQRLTGEEWRSYALSRDAKDLPVDPAIIRFPDTLLEWYHKNITKDTFALRKEDREQMQRFISILRERELCRIVRAVVVREQDCFLARFVAAPPEAVVHMIAPDVAVKVVQLVVVRSDCFARDVG